ncbi:pyridoxamine 5'-phosphate oxidase family protein [Bosea sp. 685]|uniref:pyridoxamine 5'-phosphate oxidase family protein n=1 Tax=Bosea sp. 685 TaxID=3080057 RepID=UPI0028935156|nr:pyridoxamine 5'-phosphate oxidase family protein [Bosea sp. 685]WNJ93046.1 pyridoxamine 5'-phosphate oxidase family protein [Bosea sp. 685]
MTHHTDQDRAWTLIDDIGLCMLVTHDGSSDELRSRPMSAHAARDEDAIYFLTDARNHKDDEVEINDNVCLTFADNGSYRYVSVTGTANILDDRRKIGELWSTAARAFWKSKDDPNIRVLRVRPAMAEFWDSPGKIVTTVKMAAAAITGSKPHLGDNRKVVL